jgi:dTDP-glucose pyrophosphorylase
MLINLESKIIRNKNNVVHLNFSVKKVLKKLNNQINKIIFIVDKKNRLIGSITDGDIRRKFMQGMTLNDDLVKFFNKKPLALKMDGSNYKTRINFAKKRHIRAIPVVTKKNEYLGFVRLESLIDYKDNSSNGFDVVIMAGGFGKRLLPITKKIPKPLVKIGTNPIIDALIEKCISSQINKIYIILHYKANLIKNYLVKKFPEIKLKFEFIIEKKPLDTAGGLKLIDQKTSSKNFLLINSDIITNINFDNVHKFFTENRADLVVCATKNEIIIPYGVLNINNQEVENITEKPIFDIHLNSGIYFLNKKIINQIKKNEKISAVELIKRSIKKNKKVLNYPIYENWIDIGNHSDLIKAKNLYN